MKRLIQFMDSPTVAPVLVLALARCLNPAELSVENAPPGASAFRRANRFDRCIALVPPPPSERARILSDLLTALPGARVDSHRTASSMSKLLPGATARDLSRAVVLAYAMATSSRGQTPGPVAPGTLGEGAIPGPTSAAPVAVPQAELGVALGEAHGEWACRQMGRRSLDVPAFLPPVIPGPGPSVRGSSLWDARIGGYATLRKSLEELVGWTLQGADALSRMGLAPPSGILLYGPSGCGKSLLAATLAARCQANLFLGHSSTLFTRELGGTEANIRSLFARARARTPALVVLESLEVLAPRRGGDADVHTRALCQLLTEMDGIQHAGGAGTGVMVIGCTALPWAVDPALLRPGRLEHHLLVGLPPRPDRVDILGRLAPAAPADLLNELADRTDAFTPAALCSLCREAALCAFRERAASEAKGEGGTAEATGPSESSARRPPGSPGQHMPAPSAAHFRVALEALAAFGAADPRAEEPFRQWSKAASASASAPP